MFHVPSLLLHYGHHWKARYIKSSFINALYKPRNHIPFKNVHERIIDQSSKSFSAINDLARNSVILFDEGLKVETQPFWSKKTCQEFWDEYMECEITTTQKLSLLSIEDDTKRDSRDQSCPKICYTKITKVSETFEENFYRCSNIFGIGILSNEIKRSRYYGL